MAGRMLLTAGLVVLVLVAAGYGALHYMTGVPGKPHRGALPPLTAEEAALAAALKRHIATIAAREHNVAHYDELEKVARYIEATLASFGYAVGRQEFFADGKPVRNIDATIEPPRRTMPIPRSSWSAPITTACAARRAPTTMRSGAAAVIELARLLRDLARHAAPSASGSCSSSTRSRPISGPRPWAASTMRARSPNDDERVVAMYSLETIGFYSSEPGSQDYPAPFGLMFPDRGDFVAFVGLLGSRALLQETMRSFRSHTAFPSIGGVAPGAVPGIAWSDHWAFAEHGFQAVMITDTALFRYPHYHRATDTPDKVDDESLARVVKGHRARHPRSGASSRTECMPDRIMPAAPARRPASAAARRSWSGT